MRKVMLIAAVAAVSACQQKAAEPANGANVAEANQAAPAATPAAMSLNETSWTFTEDGKKILESIDASGNYIASSVAEDVDHVDHGNHVDHIDHGDHGGHGDQGAHVDHGTYVAKDGKHCFTSAMNKEGEVCWTSKGAAIGETVEAVSDKGEKLMVTRVAYVAATMPAAN